MALDSESLTTAILALNPDLDTARLVDKPLPRRAVQQAQSTIKRKRFHASQLCNEQYNFKLTSQGVEVRAHLCDSVLDEHGRWALSSTQHCRYDGQPFSGPPAAVPTGCHSGAWKTYGCFCSWSCALGFVEQQDLTDSEHSRRRDLLRELAYSYFGISHVHPPLPLEALHIYGGYLSLEEWRAAAQNQHSTMLYEPPLEPFDIVVIERFYDWEMRRQHYAYYYGRNPEERKQKEQARQEKIDQDLLLASSRESTRLRRQTTNKNTLWQTMGITLIEDT